MKTYVPEHLYDEIDNCFAKNEEAIGNWLKLIDHKRHELFKKYCLKDYLDSCEPAYCTYLISNECKFPTAISELEKYLEGKKPL